MNFGDFDCIWVKDKKLTLYFKRGTSDEKEVSRAFQEFIFFRSQGTLVGQKLFTHWAPPEQFFAVSPENTDSPKKLFNMKTFSIKFVIKKITFNFGVR